MRGYLPREFDALKQENPGIHFIENPLFESTNNISSAIAAADFIRDAYVFESDLLLRNPQLITRYQYATNYIGVPVKHTDDWCLRKAVTIAITCLAFRTGLPQMANVLPTA